MNTERPKKLKGYIMSNYDGRRAAMVAASTLKEAAQKLRTSVYSLQQMGWSQAEGDDLTAALANPDAILYRPIMAFDAKTWTTDRDGARPNR